MKTKDACVKSGRVRSSGTVVEVWRNREAGFDTDGGPYSTICEHGTVLNHLTLRDALSWRTRSLEWCEYCLEEKEKP